MLGLRPRSAVGARRARRCRRRTALAERRLAGGMGCLRISPVHRAVTGGAVTEFRGRVDRHVAASAVRMLGRVVAAGTHLGLAEQPLLGGWTSESAAPARLDESLTLPRFAGD